MILIGIIILIGAFLRFYNMAEVVQFEFDDQYNAYLVYNLVKNGDFSLVGQETSFGGMFLGPWHYLFLTPFYLLTNLHPIGGYIGEAVIGLLTIFSYYLVGKKIFSEKVGLLAAFLRAILVNLILQDWNIGPAYPAELVAIWFIYFLVRLYQGSMKSLLALSFLTGMMFTIHLVILPLVIVLLITLIFKSIRPPLSIWFKSLVVFILPVLPILLFEIRHKFIHIQGFLKTLASGGRESSNLGQRLSDQLFYNLNYFYRLFDDRFLPSFLGLVIFFLIAFFLWKRLGEFKHSYHRFIFWTIFLIVTLYYLIYPRHVSQYYFMALRPLTILYVSALILSVWTVKRGKIIGLAFITFVVLSNLGRLIGLHTDTHKKSLAYKEAVVKSIIENQRGKGEFSVSYFMKKGWEFGYQYLFTYYGLNPRSEIKPPIYSIVYPKTQVAEKDLSRSFGSIGVIFPEDEPEQGK